MSKDLIKENGNQATIGSIPQLFIPRDLGRKLTLGTAVWADFEAAGITKGFIKNLIANNQIPRFVLQYGLDEDHYTLTGSGGYIRVANMEIANALGVEAGGMIAGEGDYKVLLEFTPWGSNPFSFYFAEV